VIRVIDSMDGIPPSGVELEEVDLAPCAPDGVVDQSDLDAAQAALARLPFPCVEPCETTSLSDLSLYLECMEGPLIPPVTECDVFDYDGDGDVDVTDFGTFQKIFVAN
jgi:hypothetical protein